MLVVAAVVVGAIAVTRISGVVLRTVVRRMADRSRLEVSDRRGRRWRPGVSRGMLDVVDGGETRRRQRVDSAARMLNHLVALVIWIVVTIAVFHVLDIDAAFFLSSAGFIGAGLAIGGQHKVNDYLTGLSVLFEDRYGVGDELVVEIPGRDPLRAVVEHIGLITTRLRDEQSTLHLPNGAITLVRNLSQEAHHETLRLNVADNPEFDLVSEQTAADVVRRMAGTENLTEVLFLGDLAATRQADGNIDVEFNTARPLPQRAKDMIAGRAEESLRGRR